MCLCADLILTLRNPFSPPKRRLRIYYLISSSVPIIVFSMVGLYVGTDTEDDCTQCINKSLFSASGYVVGSMFTGPGNLVLAFSFSFYMLLAFLSIFYAQRRLARPGVSDGVRRMYMKQHYYYVFMFIVIWTL